MVLGLGRVAAELWAESLLRQARAQLDRQHFRQARLHLDRVLRLRPRSASTHLLAARAARLDGAFDQAGAHLDRYSFLQGEDHEAHQLECLMLRAQKGEAEEVQASLWRYVTMRRPEAGPILWALTDGFLRIARIDQAHACLEQWLQLEPNNVQAHYWLGRIYHGAHRLTKAEEELRRAVALDPEHCPARLSLGAVYIEKLEWPRATEHFEKACQLQPDSPEARLGLAQCRWVVGKRSQAIALLDELLERHPDNADALAQRGQYALLAETPAAAEKWLRRALEHEPAHFTAAYQLFLCLSRMERREEAAALSNRVVHLEEDSRRMHLLGTEALLNSPTNPVLYYEMGAILMRQGREDRALPWLLRAHALFAGHVPTNRMLADYYERHGEPERAQLHRTQARAVSSSVSP